MFSFIFYHLSCAGFFENTFFGESLLVLFFTVILNLYEIYTHLYTTLKFFGAKVRGPLGSREDQTLREFLLSDAIDALGWILFIAVYGYSHVIVSVFLSFHLTTIILSVYDWRNFQDYMIANPKNRRFSENEVSSNIVNDTFGYKYWRWFKSFFVFADASARIFYIVYPFL